MSNAKLVESVKKAVEALDRYVRWEPSDGERARESVTKAMCDAMEDMQLPAILALLEACGTATPEQVRAALDSARCDCGKLATCFGSYEGQEPSFGCDTCCGHGCEDGHCDVFHKSAAVAQKGGEDK